MSMLERLSLILTKAENAKFVEHFCEADVEFLIVGGTALAVHDCRGAADVDDLDILISPTIENAQRTYSALTAAQVTLCARPESLTKLAIQIPIKNCQYWAEVLTPRKGFDFEEMLRSSLPISFRSRTLYIASRNDLLKMKEDAVSEVSRVLAKHEKDLACLRNA
jgi:hypothetical protein